MEIDVILFDWGGTLAHVIRQEESLLRGASLAARAAADISDPQVIHGLIRMVLSAEAAAAADPDLREVDLVALLGSWATSEGRDLPQERLREAVRVVGESWVGSLDVFPGVVESLTELRRRGYRMGLVSNVIIPHQFCLMELDRQGILPLLDFAVTSSQVGYRKPSRRFYEEAIRQSFPDGRAAAPSRVLFVGDSPGFDVIGPAELGMKTALVASPVGTWPQADYERARPDLRIDSVAELPGLLARHAGSRP